MHYKQPKSNPERRPGIAYGVLAAAIAALATPAAHAAWSSKQCGTGWNTNSNGYHIANKQKSNKEGWSCMRWDTSGSKEKFEVTWNVTGGAIWPRIERSTRANSYGYPKRVDSIGRERWVGWRSYFTNASGPRQYGMYIWLDSSNPPTWSYTHEVNVWEWHTSGDPGANSGWEWIGTRYQNGSNYKVWKKWNTYAGQYWSWLCRRQNERMNGWFEFEGMLKWLRGRGLPNHYVVSVALTIEAHGDWSDSKGKWTATDITIATL